MGQWENIQAPDNGEREGGWKGEKPAQQAPASSLFLVCADVDLAANW